MLYVLDLCSGTGNFSRSFELHPNYSVIRIEIDPKYEDVPYTQIKSVLDWMDWIDELPPIHVVLASPPCTEYSLARGKKTDPDTSVWQACQDIIDHLDPDWYIIENVRGAISTWGPANQSLGPFYFWGRFPRLHVHVRYSGQAWFPHAKASPKTKGDGKWIFDTSKAHEEYNKWDQENNAAIPLIISEAILDELEMFQTLERWING